MVGNLFILFANNTSNVLSTRLGPNLIGSFLCKILKHSELKIAEIKAKPRVKPCAWGEF